MRAGSAPSRGWISSTIGRSWTASDGTRKTSGAPSKVSSARLSAPGMRLRARAFGDGRPAQCPRAFRAVGTDRRTRSRDRCRGSVAAGRLTRCRRGRTRRRGPCPGRGDAVDEGAVGRHARVELAEQYGAVAEAADPDDVLLARVDRVVVALVAARAECGDEQQRRGERPGARAADTTLRYHSRATAAAATRAVAINTAPATCRRSSMRSRRVRRGGFQTVSKSGMGMPPRSSRPCAERPASARPMSVVRRLPPSAVSVTIDRITRSRSSAG
jgi:hypothetical protein